MFCVMFKFNVLNNGARLVQLLPYFTDEEAESEKRAAAQSRAPGK